MPANGTVTRSGSADHYAAYAYAYFGEGTYYKYSRVTKIRSQLGVEPSYSLCEIPVATGTDETAPTIAGVTSSPLASIKGGMRAKIVIGTSTTQLVRMVGSVRNASGEFGEERDDGLVEIVDDRWLLRALPLVGSFWATITGSAETYAFRDWRWHINPKGQPNCMLREVSGWPNLVPMLCAPGQGLGIDDDPADIRDSSAARSKACLWTHTALAEAIRFATSYKASTIVSDMRYPNWGALGTAGYPIIWEPGFSAALEADATSDNQICKERVLEATNVIHLLDEICQEAGPYRLYMGPHVHLDADGAEVWSSELQIVRSSYNGGGLTYNRPTSGYASDVLSDPKEVTSGSLHESYGDTYTRFMGAGALNFIERRVDTKTSGGISGLIAAWSSADQAAWLNLVKAGVARGSLSAQAAGIEDANRAYPHVFCAYRIDPTYDFQDGTSESGKSIANAARPILPTLLSSYLESSTGSANTKDKYHFRRPVLVEYNDGTDWLCAIYNDGFSLDGAGVMYFSGLREGGQTYVLAGSHGSETVTAYDLRMSVAIGSDHRLRAQLDGQALTDLADADDRDRVDQNLLRTYYADFEDRYAKEIRVGGGATSNTNAASFPVAPQVASGSPGTAKDGLGTNGYLRDDSDKLTEALRGRARKYNRVQRGGTLIRQRVTGVEEPGRPIKSIKNTDGTEYPIKAIIQSVEFITGEPEQLTRIELDNI